MSSVGTSDVSTEYKDDSGEVTVDVAMVDVCAGVRFKRGCDSAAKLSVKICGSPAGRTGRFDRDAIHLSLSGACHEVTEGEVGARFERGVLCTKRKLPCVKVHETRANFKRFINHEFDSKAGERKARVEVGCYGDSTVYKLECLGKCPTCRMNHDERGASHLSFVCGKSMVIDEMRFERGVFTTTAEMVCGLRKKRANTDRFINECKMFVCGCVVVGKVLGVKKIVMKKVIIKKLVVKKMIVKCLSLKKNLSEVGEQERIEYARGEFVIGRFWLCVVRCDRF